MRRTYNEEEYKAKLEELYDGEIKMVGRYKGFSLPVLLQDNYGVMKCAKASIALSYKPSIKIALNKTDYFMNLLKDLLPSVFKEIIPKSEYKAMKLKMIFDTKFGLIAQTPDNLIHGHLPTIRVAIDRKDYFKRLLLLLYDDKYDFEIDSTNRHDGRVVLICPIHGKQSVDSDTVFTGCGCPKCNKDLTPSNVFYLVKLSNTEESFYKLGISHRTKNGKISRFASYKSLGFNIEVLKLIEFLEALDCKQFELEMKKIIKPFLYIPNKWDYKTSTETFSDNILNVIMENINNVKYDIVSTSDESQSKESVMTY